MRRSNVEGTKI